MDQRNHFLQAILEQPDDDALRLVFADWLEEQGDAARAEFIRVQCTLADMSPLDPRHAGLYSRQQDLLCTHEHVWGAEVPALQGVYCNGFDRGFPGHLVVNDMNAFFQQTALIFATVPVQRLTLAMLNVAAPLKQLVAEPCLAQVAELEIAYTPLSDAAVEPLFQSPFVGRLRWLRLDGLNLTEDVVRSLVESPVLRQLEALSLCRNRIGPTGAKVLARAGPLPRLGKLILGGNPLGEGALALAAASTLAAVTYLDLAVCQLRDDTIVNLAASDHLSRLETLHLQSNGITDVGAAALAESASLQGLSELYLLGNHIGLEGERRLRERFGQRVHIFSHSGR